MQSLKELIANAGFVLSEEEVEKRIAYEVSVSKLELLEDEYTETGNENVNTCRTVLADC